MYLTDDISKHNWYAFINKFNSSIVNSLGYSYSEKEIPFQTKQKILTQLSPSEGEEIYLGITVRMKTGLSFPFCHRHKFAHVSKLGQYKTAGTDHQTNKPRLDTQWPGLIIRQDVPIFLLVA